MKTGYEIKTIETQSDVIYDFFKLKNTTVQRRKIRVIF